MIWAQKVHPTDATTVTEPTLTTSKPSTAKPVGAFTGALIVSGVVWLSLSVVLITVVSLMAAGYLRETILVTLLSGLVAAISLTPGLVSEWTLKLNSQRSKQAVQSASAAKANQNYLGPVFGGIILRLVATVALFVMCRYQFAESANWIAALTIGWYVVLTVVEVTLLAKKLPKLDAASTVTPLVASGLMPSTPDIA
jgi:hypothetical protein